MLVTKRYMNHMNITSPTVMLTSILSVLNFHCIYTFGRQIQISKLTYSAFKLYICLECKVPRRETTILVLLMSFSFSWKEVACSDLIPSNDPGYFISNSSKREQTEMVSNPKCCKTKFLQLCTAGFKKWEGGISILLFEEMGTSEIHCNIFYWQH